MTRTLTTVFLVILAVPLLAAVTALPRRGAPDAPVHTRVSARYLAAGPDEAGPDNVVTGVLLNYRGLDTFGEVAVIFTALAAALAVLGSRQGAAVEHTAAAHASPSLVVAFAIRTLAPFIAMFAIFVILKGTTQPGGGFQGGAILAALVIAVSIVFGAEYGRRLIPDSTGAWLRAAGPVMFLTVGCVGTILTGSVLGFPADPALHLVRELMFVGLEAGIAVGGATILASVFLAIEDL